MALKMVKGGRRPMTASQCAAKVRSAILSAYEGLGGELALIQWAQDNPDAFYKAFASLARDHKTDDDDDGEITVIERHVFRPGVEPVWTPPRGD